MADAKILGKCSVAPGPYGAGYGITLRQHYAGLAMHAILSSPNTVGPDPDLVIEQVSRISVKAADALLAELAKEEG